MANMCSPLFIKFFL